MIVVVTDNFSVYHDLVDELKRRDVTFTTVEPGDPLPNETSIIITGSDDDIDVPSTPVVSADPDHPRPAVEEALARLRGDRGRTIVGVDPGTRPGIAVLSGDLVVAAFHVPLSDAPSTIRGAIENAHDPIVRIGDGARLQGLSIINALEDVRIELVDETGTTPSLGTGARGMGDVLAAVNIARMPGESIESREIEPTDGELTVIQRRSRQRSPDNRAIDTALARRVALGEMTVDEALAEHREA